MATVLCIFAGASCLFVTPHRSVNLGSTGKQSRPHRPATFRLPLLQIYLSTLEHSRQTKQQQAPYTIDANLISSVTKTRILEAAASSKGLPLMLCTSNQHRSKQRLVLQLLRAQTKASCSARILQT
jgi:hypothetical protein